ncbi:DEAD/DEAH box helicase [Flavonifractor plautii]|nr:DEAD/DEAH box helicase [Flavonifractor plautii]
MLGCAQTGTGKTCAFAAPILQQLSGRKAQGRPIRALILTPTRELALQIQESFEAYGKYLPLRSTVIFGGVGQAPQVERLKRAWTSWWPPRPPGRPLRPEAHRPVPAGDLRAGRGRPDAGHGLHPRRAPHPWLAARPKADSFLLRHHAPEVQGLVDSLLHNPAKVAVNPISSPVEVIDQKLYYVDRGNKTRLLAALIRELDVKNALVFTRTKHGANKVAGDLVKAGISAAAIHGNKSQTARQQALADFKGGAVQVLVATDIAARGLDIEELSHVFNYNLPDVPETYVHRIGRTGRAGRGGTAISFCDINEKDELKAIEKLIGRAIPVVEGHPWPMEVLEPLPRDKKGRMVNPEDAEARAAARSAAASGMRPTRPPPRPERPRPTKRYWSSLPSRSQPGRPPPKAPQAGPAQQRHPGGGPDGHCPRPAGSGGICRLPQARPLASDVIMDATARLLAPRGRAQAAPKKDKPVEQPAKKRKKAARPRNPCEAGAPGGTEAQGQRTPRRPGPSPEVTLRTNGQKDSTEQPSLMKPYYLSHD